jgi:hypothetical protein
MGGIIVFLLWFIFANLGIIFTYRQVFSVKIAIKVIFLPISARLVANSLYLCPNNEDVLLNMESLS